MNKITTCFFMILFCLVGSHQVFAQDNTSSSSSVSIQNISMQDMVLDNKEYKAGEMIDTSFTFRNDDPSDYPDVYVIPSIIQINKAGYVTSSYGFGDKQGPFFVTKNSSRIISLKYVLPKVIASSTDSTYLALLVQSGSGATLGLIRKPITIIDTSSALKINESYLQVGAKKYALQAGPTVESNQEINLYLNLKGDSKSELILTPQLKIYDQQPSRPLVEETSLSPIVVQPNKDSVFNISLPKLSKPAIYAGEIHLLDKDGVERAQTLFFRWIIDGPIVTIPQVTIDKSSVSSGEQVSLDVIYTGSPINIDTGKAYDVGTGDLSAQLFNEKNILVASSSALVDFNLPRGEHVFQLTTQKDASALRLLVIASKDGKELTRYETNLTNPDTKSNTSPDEVPVFLSIILVVISISSLYFIFRKKKSLLMIIFAFFLGVGFFININTAEASTANDGLMFASANLNSGLFSPGQDMKGDISFSTAAYICTNAGKTTDVKYYIDNKLQGSDSYNEPSPGETFTFAGWNSPTYTPSATTKIKAPLSPGPHTLKMVISLATNYIISGQSTGETHSLTFAFPFTVVCGKGTKNIGGTCEKTVNGVCTSPISSITPPINLCTSGKPSGTSVQGPNYLWTCNGAGGGTDTSCQSTRTCPLNQIISGDSCSACPTGTSPNAGATLCVSDNGSSNTPTNTPTNTPSNNCSTLINNPSVTPSFVATPSSKCTLNWNPSDSSGSGICSSRSPITCKVDTGSYTPVSVSSSASISVGTHTLVCTDGTDTATSTVKCKLSPSYGEF